MKPSHKIPAIAGLSLAVMIALAQTAPAQTTASSGKTLTGFQRPESVVAHPDGRIFISEIGESGTPGDGKISQINPDGGIRTLADGLNDPKGLDLFNDQLYVTDVDQVWRVGLDGSKMVIAKAEDFPSKPVFLNDLEIDGLGNVYVSDSGAAAIYRIAADGQISKVMDEASAIASPNGLLLDGLNRLLVADFATGTLFQVTFSEHAAPVVSALNSGFGGADGLVRDSDGLLYVSDWKGGHIWQLSEPKATPQRISSGHQSAADIGLSADGRFILVPDMQAGELIWVPIKQDVAGRGNFPLIPPFPAPVPQQTATPAPSR